MRGRGWRAVLCFSPQSCGVPPLFGGDRFSVPHGDSVRHPFGIPGRAGPVLVALRQQAGRAILYHIIFLIMSILYHGKKLRTPSFQCPAYARSAATECNAPDSFVYNAI